MHQKLTEMNHKW